MGGIVCVVCLSVIAYRVAASPACLSFETKSITRAWLSKALGALIANWPNKGVSSKWPLIKQGKQKIGGRRPIAMKISRRRLYFYIIPFIATIYHILLPPLLLRHLLSLTWEIDDVHRYLWVSRKFDKKPWPPLSQVACMLRDPLPLPAWFRKRIENWAFFDKERCSILAFFLKHQT